MVSSLGYQRMREVLQEELPATTPSYAKFGQLCKTAAWGVAGAASVVAKVFVDRTNALAQLGLSFLLGASVQGLANRLLPVKWLRVQQHELMRLSGTAYFIAVQVYLNTESPHTQDAALQCSTVLLGLQLVALINAYWHHHPHRVALLAESNAPPLPINAAQNKSTTLPLFCDSHRGQQASHVLYLVIGATCWVLTRYVDSPEGKNGLQFIGTFTLGSVGGSLTWKQVENAWNRLESTFDREQEEAVQQNLFETPSPSYQLKALKFLRKYIRMFGPLAIGGLFKKPCWQTAIPIGMLSGALEESYAYAFTHTPIDRFLDVQKISLSKWEERGVRSWKYARTAAEQGALIWFTYRVMTDPGATWIDRTVFGQFPPSYWLSYVCSLSAGTYFNPHTSSPRMTHFFYRTVYKSDLFVYPFLYILNAGIKIGDESLQGYSTTGVAIACLGWISLGMGLGFQAGGADSLALGPELPKIPLPGLMLLAEWAASSV